LVVADGKLLKFKLWKDGTESRPAIELPRQVVRVIGSDQGEAAAFETIGSDNTRQSSFYLVGEGRHDALELTGHATAPWNVIFGPDKCLALSLSDDGTNRLWDLRSGKQITCFAGNQWSNEGAGTGPSPPRGRFGAFSPDGKLIGVYSQGDVHVYTIAGEKKTSWHVHDWREVSSLHFSRDSKSIFAVLVGMGNNKLMDTFLQLDLESNNVHHFRSELDGNFGVVMPDGNRVLTIENQPGAISIWDVSKKEQISVLHTGIRRLNSAALSPRGTYLLTAVDDNEVALWTTRNAQRVLTQGTFRIPVQDNQQTSIDSVFFSPDGKYFAAAFSTIDTASLTVWAAPEFCWNIEQPVIESAALPDGTVREIAKDGFVTYRNP
jgi:WD40 repeat protein